MSLETGDPFEEDEAYEKYKATEIQKIRNLVEKISKVDNLQNIKDSNPKDSIGVKKVSMSYVPAPVLMELALAMMEGGFKYRRHNYRKIGVRASVYYDATIRHLMQYWEGEDDDPDSKLCHLTKAIASLVVWRDAMMQGKYVDDRPPKHHKQGWGGDMNKHVGKLMELYPNQKPPYTEIEDGNSSNV